MVTIKSRALAANAKRVIVSLFEVTKPFNYNDKINNLSFYRVQVSAFNYTFLEKFIN